MVAIRILQPLGPDHVFDITRNNVISLVTSPMTVKDLLLDICRSSTTAMEQYLHAYPLSRDYSCSILGDIYTPSITMASYLEEPSTHAMFASNVTVLRYVSRHFAAAKTVLMGLQALAWSMKISLPEQSRLCFEGLDGETRNKESLQDVPTQIALPQYEEVRHALQDDGGDETRDRYHLGQLISRWSAMSLA